MGERLAGHRVGRCMRVVGAALLLVLVAVLVACPRSPGPESAQNARVAVSDGWLAMGTFFEADLRVRAREVEQARAWLGWARVELDRLEAVYSRHDPASSLSELNRLLARESAVASGVALADPLGSILVRSIGIWQATGGAFDVTVGPLVELWQRAAERGAWPSVDSLRKAKGRVGSDRLALAPDGRLGVTTRRLRIDLDAVSKGAALDQLAVALEARLPGTPALLSLGQSSIRALGDPDGRGWVLAVQSRAPEGGPLATVRVRDRAISVSSSLGSTSDIAGQTVSHIIDPRTGATVEGTVEAVVIGASALEADGWSTGLLVLGAKRDSIRLVEKAGLEAYVFDSSGRTVASSGWESHLAPSVGAR